MRWILLTVAVVCLLGFGGLLASAALDRPSRSYRDTVVVEAPREAIWALLTEFERYADWNPYIRRGSGVAVEDTDIELTFRTSGSASETHTAEVLIVHPMRKLEWRTRMLAPGILDREQIFRVIPDGDGRFQVVQDARLEGVLVPVTDFGDDEAGLRAMLAAIAELAPDYQSPGP